MMYNRTTRRLVSSPPFWTLPVREVVEELQTDPMRGISEEEAQRRLKSFGLNVIEKSRQSPWVFILLNQFKSPLILVLVLAGGITLFIGHYQDAIFISAAVFVNALLGFYQEFK